MKNASYNDWGQASIAFDEIASFKTDHDLADANEAQTRFDVIDRIVRKVLAWQHGQIYVEEYSKGSDGYVDYLLRAGDNTIVIEAKRYGAAFPSPTRAAKLKMNGSVLGQGAIQEAINQAKNYAEAKHADVVVVTNGHCWCFFAYNDSGDDAYASLLFPFQHDNHAQQLYEQFNVHGVTEGSLSRITNQLVRREDRLRFAFPGADGRLEKRNNIADFLQPALNNALFADALTADAENLRSCFVTSESRTKYDSVLEMHLSDPKPRNVTPAQRINTGKPRGGLQQMIEKSEPSHAPPVTVILGSVGSGKSTFLKHFELVSGRNVLQKQKAHWIYIDFEAMGPGGDVRAFIYGELRAYLLDDHPGNPTDFRSLVEPAYRKELEGLARGPYATIANDQDKWRTVVAEHIASDYNEVEPYVDKLLKHLASLHLCVIVLDNIDLSEDSDLEKAVFLEGLSLSKRICSHILVSIRDTTYVRHMRDSTFDAYELRKFWIDPPPLRAVLSKRLTYSKQILHNKPATFRSARGAKVTVPNLADFFDIVQRSVLNGKAGDFIESVADLNIRNGLSMITEFLTSGHIQADRALESFMGGHQNYAFPFHEVFKGTMLGQWKHVKEGRSLLVNLFDAHLDARRVRLLRLTVLHFLATKAQQERTVEVSVRECIEVFSKCAASELHVLECLTQLHKSALVRTVTAESLTADSTIVATRSGGYYVRVLSRRFTYVEECMYDTAIDNSECWDRLMDLTGAIEADSTPSTRMSRREKRIKLFLDYLEEVETEMLELMPGSDWLTQIPRIRESVLKDVAYAVKQSQRYYD